MILLHPGPVNFGIELCKEAEQVRKLQNKKSNFQWRWNENGSFN